MVWHGSRSRGVIGGRIPHRICTPASRKQRRMHLNWPLDATTYHRRAVRRGIWLQGRNSVDKTDTLMSKQIFSRHQGVGRQNSDVRIIANFVSQRGSTKPANQSEPIGHAHCEQRAPVALQSLHPVPANSRLQSIAIERWVFFLNKFWLLRRQIFQRLLRNCF